MRRLRGDPSVRHQALTQCVCVNWHGRVGGRPAADKRMMWIFPLRAFIIQLYQTKNKSTYTIMCNKKLYITFSSSKTNIHEQKGSMITFNRIHENPFICVLAQAHI